MLITEANTTNKVDAMKYIVSMLQTSIEEDKEIIFSSLSSVNAYVQKPALREAVAEYLGNQTIRSRLARIAFPSANHADVALALESGSTIDALYRLACGSPFYLYEVPIAPYLLRDQNGKPVKAKHGLKIIWRAADIPPQIKNRLLARLRRTAETT